jgi:hypothetical protein
MKPDIFCWDDRNWNALTFAIHRQKCILLLGPDASMESTGPGPQPGEEVEGLKPCTEILANELAKATGEDLSMWNIDINDLPQVSQYYLVHNSPMELAAEVMAFYDSREKKTSQIHKDLATVPFYLTITSTYDSMFVNALKELPAPQKSPKVKYHNFKGRKEDNVEMGTVERPLIYQLYGSLQNPDSLIITENDFLELLVRAASGEAPIPQNILSELTNQDKCLLFLGFGFRHWYLRVLLHVLKIGSKKNPSFALEIIEPKSFEEISRSNLFIKHKGSKIQICNAKLAQFAAELAHRYNSKYGGDEPLQLNETPAELLEKPSIFISYVRENEVPARQLHEKLRENNLDAYIDRVFMEPGDEWMTKIKRLISELDYFILVLSNDLLKRRQSVVFHELKLAQERQSCLRPGLKFIIPIKIDDCELPQDLHDLHVSAIDLREDQQIDNLIKTIKRDFQLKKR